MAPSNKRASPDTERDATKSSSSSSQRRRVDDNADNAQRISTADASPPATPSTLSAGTGADDSLSHGRVQHEDDNKCPLCDDDDDDASVWRVRYFACRTELERDKQQRRQLQVELDRAQGQRQKLEEDLEGQKTQREHFQTQLEQAQAQKTRLQTNLEEEQRRCARLEANNQREQKARRQLDDELRTAVAQCHFCEVELREKIEALRREEDKRRQEEEKRRQEKDQHRKEKAELQVLRERVTESQHPLCRMKWPPHLPRTVATAPFSARPHLLATQTSHECPSQTLCLFNALAQGLGGSSACMRQTLDAYVLDGVNAPSLIKQLGTTCYEFARETVSAGRYMNRRLTLLCLAQALDIIVIYLPDAEAHGEVYGRLDSDNMVIAVTEPRSGVYELVVPASAGASDTSH